MSIKCPRCAGAMYAEGMDLRCWHCGHYIYGDVQVITPMPQKGKPRTTVFVKQAEDKAKLIEETTKIILTNAEIIIQQRYDGARWCDIAALLGLPKQRMRRAIRYLEICDEDKKQ